MMAPPTTNATRAITAWNQYGRTQAIRRAAVARPTLEKRRAIRSPPGASDPCIEIAAAAFEEPARAVRVKGQGRRRRASNPFRNRLCPISQDEGQNLKNTGGWD
jgi:hypothetical protein